MKNVSHLKKLDDVLKYFQKHHKNNPLSLNEVKSAIEKPFDFDINEIRPILNKLVKDKYLDTFIIPLLKRISPKLSYEYNEDYYSITFEGIIFIETGGYVRLEELYHAENTRLNTLAIRQIKNDEDLTQLTRLVAYGTIAAAAIALLLLIWEVRHPILRFFGH
jgi:hypothetical protein